MLAAVNQFGQYEWEEPKCIATSGMPLFVVGRSGVRFRETGRAIDSKRLQDARVVFPELQEFSWPERGTSAEYDSLILQASRFRSTPAPSNLKECCSRLCAHYPRTLPRSEFRSECWNKKETSEGAQVICEKYVNRKASPGVPLSALGTTNSSVLSSCQSLINVAVAERLEKLSQMDLNTPPNVVDLVRNGFCDPVRLFVKQEPHSRAKVEQRRFRLISSVSLIDQVVERMLFGYQNNMEIAMWRTCPSKPGMGLSLSEQAASIWKDLEHKHSVMSASEADISGFDWSVQSWELEADVEMRISLGSFPVKLANAARARFHCLANSVFQLSDGTLIAQGLPGLMKSGSYCTSSSNSRIRCLMAELIGAPWCIAMGDDSIEGYVESARDKYYDLGHVCKDYLPCEVGSSGELVSANFCSHYLSDGRFYLTSWPKTLVKFFSSENPQYSDLEVELSDNPIWPRIRKYVCRVGLGPDNLNGQSQKIESTLRHSNEVETTCVDSPTCAGCGNCFSGSPEAESPTPSGYAAGGLARWLFGHPTNNSAFCSGGNYWQT